MIREVVGDSVWGGPVGLGLWEGSSHMPFAVNTAIEDDQFLSDPAPWATEDYAMLGCCLHELQEVLVMFLRSVAIYTYIIIYGNNIWEMVC